MTSLVMYQNYIPSNVPKQSKSFIKMNSLVIYQNEFSSHVSKQIL